MRDREPVQCEKEGCPRVTYEPRRGPESGLVCCRGCYLREWRGTAIPMGAACWFRCGERNPVALVKKCGRVACLNCRAKNAARVAA
jgi:hypothetical protein